MDNYIILLLSIFINSDLYALDKIYGLTKLNEERTGTVSSHYSGSIINIYVELGDKVTQGQKIAQLKNASGFGTTLLTSPLNGTVIKREVNIGDLLHTGEVAFLISDLTALWVEYTLPPFFNPPVITIQDSDNKTIPSKVVYHSPLVNQKTQLTSVILEINNTQGNILPNQFILGQLEPNNKIYSGN